MSCKAPESKPAYDRAQPHGRRARNDRPPRHRVIQQNSTLLVAGFIRCSDDAGHPHAARGVRTFCFTKTMEKVPSDNAAPRFTKIRGIPRLRYISAQIGFSAGNQHGVGAKVARRARFSRTNLINNLPGLSDAASGAKAPRWRRFTAGLKPRPSAGGIYEMASNLRNTVFPGAN